MLVSESTDPEIWKTADECWVKNRIQSWATIQARLPSLKRIVQRKSWKYLKAYFLYGTPLPEYNTSEIWPNDGKLFEIWLNPVAPIPGEIVYDENVGSIVDLRERFRRMMEDICMGLTPEGDPDYGAMGGREQLIMLDLNRGVDPDVLVDFGSGVLYPCCYNPILSVIEQCFTDTCQELRSYGLVPLSTESFDRKYMANKRGLVLWELVSNMMEANPNWLEERIRSVREPLVFDTMEAILNYWNISVNDESRTRTKTATFAEDLHRKFESRVFCDTLMNYWDITRRKLKTDGSRFI